MKNLGSILTKIVDSLIIYFRLIHLTHKFNLSFVRTKNLKDNNEYGGFLWYDKEEGVAGFVTVGIFILYPKLLKLSIQKEIIITAHEIGHYLSSQKSGPEYSELLTAYNAYYGSFPLPYVLKAKIFEEELMAWLYGKVVLERFGFKDWDSFDKHRAWALSTYGDCYEAYEKIAQG